MAEPGITTEAVPFTFEKGIDESQEYTTLPDGFLVACANWIPEPLGALRSRAKWINGPNLRQGSGPDNHSKPYPATSRKVRSLFFCPMTDQTADSPGGIWWMAGLKNPDAGIADRPEVWATRDDFSQGWYWVDELPTACDLDTYPVAFAKGTARLLYTHPKLSFLWRWGGEIPSAVASIADTDASRTDMTYAHPGRCIAFHKGVFFMGGMDPAIANATTYRLYASGVNNGAVWPQTNYIDIGRDDSEAIRDVAPFQNNLMVGKKSGVFILLTPNMTDLTTWSTVQLEGTGAAEGRSLCPTPTGLVICGDDDVWWWAGGDPQRIGQPVQKTYQLGRGYHRMAAYVAGKVYIASWTPSVPTPPLLVFDIASGTWTTEHVGAETDQPVAVASHNNRLVAGARASTIAGPLTYRDEPFGTRGKDFFTTIAPTYHAQSPHVYLTKMQRQIRIKRVWVRVRQRGATNGSTGVAMLPYLDGVALPSPKVLNIPGADGAVQTKAYEVEGRCRALGFEWSHTPAANGGATFDIEQVLAEIDIAAVGL